MAGVNSSTLYDESESAGASIKHQFQFEYIHETTLKV